MKKFNLPDVKIDVVVLANGKFPTSKLTLSILKNASFIICCDGAVNNLSKTNITPSAIVGDCDSLSRENRIKYKNILHLNPDQETNDLTKAINYCIDRDIKSVKILGATGKREDHTIGNVSLLGEYMDKINVEMISDYGVFTPINEDSEFESYLEQQVSIFSICPETLITTVGLKYEIKNRRLTNWWQGTLNESLDKSFQVNTNGKIIIYRAF